MTVSVASNLVQTFAGNGSTQVFNYTHRFDETDELVVIVRSSAGVDTVKTLTTHYTVSGAATDGGGSVTMLTAPASGETLVIYRKTEVKQEVDLENASRNDAPSVELQLDRMTRMSQDHGARLDRAVTMRPGSSGQEMPEPSAAQIIGWNAAGTALENKAPVDLADETLPTGALKFLRRDATDAAFESLSPSEVRDALGLNTDDDVAFAGLTLTGAISAPATPTANFWPDIHSGAIVHRMGARAMIGGASNNDGNFYETTADTGTWVSTTQFTVTGDQTTKYQIGRSVKVIGSTSGTNTSTVSAVSYSSVTTVTLADAVLDSSTETLQVFTTNVGDWLSLNYDRSYTQNTQFASLNTIGRQAILGATRSSDAGEQTAGTIGITGLAFLDDANASSVYGGYFEGWAEAASTGIVHGIEVDVINLRGSPTAANPYSMFSSGITNALWVASGGDGTGATDGAFAASVALGIVHNSDDASFRGFDKGIVFSDKSLVGTDGVTGGGVAIETAKGHRWQQTANGAGVYASIAMDVSHTAEPLKLLFSDIGVLWRNSADKNLVVMPFSATDVNGFTLNTAATGVAPALEATGDDTNIDLNLVPKGSGAVNIARTGGTSILEIDGTQVLTVQQSAIASLTDSTGGSTDGTLSAISGSGADAGINDNFAELAAKQSAILTALRTHGIIAT